MAVGSSGKWEERTVPLLLLPRWLFEDQTWSKPQQRFEDQQSLEGREPGWEPCRDSNDTVLSPSVFL